MINWLLINKKFLWIVLLINIVGTIYGYYWYIPQLTETKWYYMPFVPDSPTASLFFCLYLLSLLWKKNWPLIQVLALVSLVKYGIWAVAMNILTLKVTGYLPFDGYMLIVSHGAMALEGLLYQRYYTFKVKHLLIAGIVLLHNEIIDYVFKQMPQYDILENFMDQIGYFTFWLSILTLVIVYCFYTKKHDTNG